MERNDPDQEVGLLLAEAAAAADGSAFHTPLAVPALGANEPFVADFVLAGGRVVTGGHAPEFAAFVEETGLGVINAFTCKGLFRWDSPFHLGTGLLQERDLVLAGADSESALLVVGVDATECSPALLAAAGIDVMKTAWRSLAPEALRSAAARIRPSWGSPPEPPPQPELFSVLWNVAQPLYAIDTAPLNPARAAADVAAVLGADGVVCAEPGTAGWWVARTVPTTRLGSVAVPAAGRSGSAVARALLTARGGSPALAIVDGPLSPAAAAVIEHGRRLGLSFVVEGWGDSAGGATPGAAHVDAPEHRARAEAALTASGVRVLEVAIDYTASEQLTAAAGPLVAWT